MGRTGRRGGSSREPADAVRTRPIVRGDDPRCRLSTRGGCVLAWSGAQTADGAAAWILACLALLLPARDRERFVREVTANMADRQRWWQRFEELLSVAAAVPALAVILRRARRRWA